MIQKWRRQIYYKVISLDIEESLSDDHTREPNDRAVSPLDEAKCIICSTDIHGERWVCLVCNGEWCVPVVVQVSSIEQIVFAMNARKTSCFVVSHVVSTSLNPTGYTGDKTVRHSNPYYMF